MFLFCDVDSKAHTNSCVMGADREFGGRSFALIDLNVLRSMINLTLQICNRETSLSPWSLAWQEKWDKDSCPGISAWGSLCPTVQALFWFVSRTVSVIIPLKDVGKVLGSPDINQVPFCQH